MIRLETKREHPQIQEEYRATLPESLGSWEYLGLDIITSHFLSAVCIHRRDRQVAEDVSF